jgi:hypothetical protein
MLRRKALPSSVRVLTATRRIRKGSKTTLAFLILAVNKAPSAAASRRPVALAADEEEGDATPVDEDEVSWSPPRTSCEVCHASYEDWTKLPKYGSDYDHQFANPGLCDNCLQTGHKNHKDSKDPCPVCHPDKVKAMVAVNVDLATSALVKPLLSGLTDLFTGVGGGQNVFESPAADSLVDTGHYDDGHAFSWTADTEREQLASLASWTKLTMNGRLDQLVADLEAKWNADLNGDGATGGGDSGTTIETHVGAPVVTGGGFGP